MAVPPDLADAAHLTAILRRNGVLADGRVREVTADAPRNMILSRIVRLRLAYEGMADGAPASLILKLPLPRAGGPVAWAGREVAFYRDVAPATPPGLVMRCYDTAFDGDSKDWHLVLEDLTDTHTIATEWPVPPTDAQCRAIVGTFARFHAAWWDDKRLGVSLGDWVTPAMAQERLKFLQDSWRRFSDLLGDRLSPERRALYERFVAGPLPFLARQETRRNLCIVHGDSHIWNVFLPKGGDGAPRLFDWDAWRLGVAAFDLAYMMATHWYPERRRLFERPLLDHYHATLVEAGVRDYDRRALDDDYRMSVLMQLAVPLNQFNASIPPIIWWGHLERITAAVDDLGCRDLLA
jgi:thiamine kinase-like enzyme